MLTEKVVRFSTFRSAGAPSGVKTLHIVRHAEGTHNVASNPKAAEHFDAMLTSLGEQQCAKLHDLTQSAMPGGPPQLIVSSPLTRTLKTAEICFATAIASGAPVVAEENFRETVNYLPDARRTTRELSIDFPYVDFSRIKNEEDPLWAKYVAKFGDHEAHLDLRETNDAVGLAIRVRAAMEFLASRSERTIAVVSHQAFLLHMMGVMESRLNLVEFADRDVEELLCKKPWANCEVRTVNAEILVSPTREQQGQQHRPLPFLMSTSRQALLYGMNGCPFCASAETLLKQEGVVYTYIDIGTSEEERMKLATLTGDSPDKLTVPKLFLNGTLIRSSEELQDLRATSALAHLAQGTLVRAPRAALPDLSSDLTVCILHTGPQTTVWLAEVKKRLATKEAKVTFLDVEHLGTFDLCESLPFSVVVNRVSDAVPPPLARFVCSFLSFCMSQGLPVVNGPGSYSVATSKISQHGFFTKAGLRTPRSFLVRCVADVDAAIAKLGGGTILFKPNAGSFGKGINKFDDMAKLREHAARPSAYGNDGMAVLQEYHAVSEVHRIFVLNGMVQCGVTTTIDTSQEFTAQCMASAQKRQKKGGGSAVRPMGQVPDAVREGCKQAMAAAQADVGSIEYLIEPETCQPLYFDLNLLSTYPDPALVGRDCWQELADFVLARAKA